MICSELEALDLILEPLLGSAGVKDTYVFEENDTFYKLAYPRANVIEFLDFLNEHQKKENIKMMKETEKDRRHHEEEEEKAGVESLHQDTPGKWNRINPNDFRPRRLQNDDSKYQRKSHFLSIFKERKKRSIM